MTSPANLARDRKCRHRERAHKLRDETMAMSPAAERMARTRARRRDGLIHLEFDANHALLEDALLRRGLLAAHKVDDKSKFAAAALVALHEWAEAQLTPPVVPDDQSVARNFLARRFVG